MRVLLTGGTGFIGASLARELVSLGHEVRGLVRATSKTALLEAAGASKVIGDVRDRASLDRALEGVDGVVHLAGVTKARTTDEYYRVNGDGTRALAEACAARTTPPRFVYVSSLAAAGPSTPERPKLEDDPATPISHYGRSKRDGEVAVQSLAGRLPALIVRPPIVFGPRDTDFFEVYKMARRGLALKAGFAPKRFSIVHVDDLAQGIARALTHGAPLSASGSGGTYHVADPGTYAWEELAQLVGQTLGKSVRVFAVPESLGFLAALGAELKARLQNKPEILSLDKAREMRGSSWTCDTSRARNELQFAPAFSLPERIAQTTAWYRENGWLQG